MSALLDREARFAGRRSCVMRGGAMWASLLAEEHGDKAAVLVAEVEAGRDVIARAAVAVRDARCGRLMGLREAFWLARAGRPLVR